MKKILIASFLSIYSFVFTKPKVTIVLVIDQFAAHYINKLDSYLQHGIHHLLKNGIVYVNTNLPYGATATAVGHTSLSTGALPKDHGVICNAWLDDQGNKVKFEDGYDARHFYFPRSISHFLKKIVITNQYPYLLKEGLPWEWPAKKLRRSGSMNQ